MRQHATPLESAGATGVLKSGRSAKTGQDSASPDPANAARCLERAEEPFGALADAEMFLNTFHTYISLDFYSKNSFRALVNDANNSTMVMGTKTLSTTFHYWSTKACFLNTYHTYN